MAKKKIFKNDGTVPIEDILCTTYQMRNFYAQLRDGFFSDLDIMNYIQHHRASLMLRSGDTVLDVCCGRGLMLPLIRWNRKTIKKYIGIDIELKNIESMRKNICNGKPINPEEYFPFETEWKIANVAKIYRRLKEYEKQIDFVIYTSSIEHMNKEDGEASLEGISKLTKPGGTLFISCPNTPEDQSGFDVRYKAHVYEWKLSELRRQLIKNGFEIEKEIGLTGDISTWKEIREDMKGDIVPVYDLMREYLPTPWFKSVAFLNYPEKASEVLLLCKRK